MMKNSQIAIVSALGFIAFLIVLGIGGARIAISKTSSNEMSKHNHGDLSTNNPQLKDFQSLEINGTWSVTLKQGEKWNVELNYPEDMQEHIQATVVGNRLILNTNWQSKGWGQNKSLSANIIMPNLESIEISGAGNVNYSGFEGDSLTI